MPPEFHQKVSSIPPDFRQSSARIPPEFRQNSARIPPALAQTCSLFDLQKTNLKVFGLKNGRKLARKAKILTFQSGISGIKNLVYIGTDCSCF
jgi:hypothetical protein